MRRSRKTKDRPSRPRVGIIPNDGAEGHVIRGGTVGSAHIVEIQASGILSSGSHVLMFPVCREISEAWQLSHVPAMPALTPPQPPPRRQARGIKWCSRLHLTVFRPRCSPSRLQPISSPTASILGGGKKLNRRPSALSPPKTCLQCGARCPTLASSWSLSRSEIVQILCFFLA